MNELEKRIEAAQAVMNQLPEWALQNMYWSGGNDPHSPYSATEIINQPHVVYTIKDE